MRPLKVDPGARYGKYTILHEVERKHYGPLKAPKRVFLCRCDCGVEREILLGSLTSGNSSSCGCGKLTDRGENRPDPVDGATWIPLAHNKWMLVDEGDADLFEGKKLKVHQNGYAYWSGSLNGDPIRQHPAHRLILGLGTFVETGLHTDHINGIRLDNRKSNLRACTPIQNSWNKSQPNKYGFRGIQKVNKKWIARIRPNGIHTHIGIFDSPEEAARAYDVAAKKYYGEFAKLNFPTELNQLNLT